MCTLKNKVHFARAEQLWQALTVFCVMYHADISLKTFPDLSLSANDGRLMCGPHMLTQINQSISQSVNQSINF